MCAESAPSSQRLLAALFAAMLLPAATLLCRLSYAAVAGGALAAGGVYYIMYTVERRRSGHGGQSARLFCPPWLVAAGAVWLLLGTARIAAQSPGFFPQSGGAPWVGLGLLVLSALAAQAGTEVLLRASAILLVPLCAVFGAVLLCSLPQLQVQWLLPAPDAAQLATAFVLCLLPGTALRLLPYRLPRPRSAAGWAAAFALFATATAAITAGCLSAELAQQENSFYILSRSLSLFGVMLRLEVLVSGALTGCAFLACSVLLLLARRLLASAGLRHGLRPWLCPAACALLLYPSMALPGWSYLVGSGIFCAVFAWRTPAVAAPENGQKNFWKMQKTC